MAQTSRLLSLDVMRGITISGMILVNDPGSWTYVYAPLRHAQWNGFTPTELSILLTGCVVAFLVSIAAIRFLMGFVRRHDFKPFGWYRIVLGVAVIAWFALVG